MTDQTEKNIKLRLTYSKTGLIRFISHRDLIRVFFRAFSRAGLPVACSQGFSPHPKVSFCPPLKVGMEGLSELLDLELSAPVEETEAVAALNLCLPEGLEAGSARILPPDAPSLSAGLEWAGYLVELRDPVSLPAGAVERFLAADEVPLPWTRKGQMKTIDARRGVEELSREGERGLRMVLSLRENGRPYPVLAALTGADPALLPGLRWRRTGFGP